MRKVLVIGCPGSGKSVLARDIARRTGLPLVHLDALYHADGWSADKDAKKGQWRERVAELVKGDAWVMDGNYKGTLDLRVPAADTVVFLDYPRRVSLLRALRRRWEYRGGRRRPDMPEGWHERISPDFLRFIWTYRRQERPRVLALLEKHRLGRAVHVLTGPAETERFLRSL